MGVPELGCRHQRLQRFPHLAGHAVRLRAGVGHQGLSLRRADRRAAVVDHRAAVALAAGLGVPRRARERRGGASHGRERQRRQARGLHAVGGLCRHRRRHVHAVRLLHPSRKPGLPDHHPDPDHGGGGRHRLGARRHRRRADLRPDLGTAAPGAVVPGNHLWRDSHGLHDVRSPGLFAGRQGARARRPPWLPPRPSKGVPHEPAPPPRGAGPDRQVRRPDRDQRPVHAGRARPHPRADRPERRRQVHHLQLHLALLPSHQRPHQLRRRRHHAQEAA